MGKLVNIESYIKEIIIPNSEPLFKANENLIVDTKIIDKKNGSQYETLQWTIDIELKMNKERNILLDHFTEIRDGCKLNFEGILYLMFTGKDFTDFKPLYVGISHIFGKKYGELNKLIKDCTMPRWNYREKSNGHLDKMNTAIFNRRKGLDINSINRKVSSNEKDKWVDKMFDFEIIKNGNQKAVKLKSEIFLFYKAWQNTDSVLKYAYGIENYKPSLHAEEQILIQQMGQYYADSLLNITGSM